MFAGLSDFTPPPTPPPEPPSSPSGKRKLVETRYSCGPISESHAGGWSQEDYRKDYHQYLNVRGGFLSVTVERTDGKAPSIAFRFHDPKATEVLFEKVYTAR